MKGVSKPSQFDGLSNGPDGCLDATGLYLVSSSAMTFANSSSENLYEYELHCVIHPLKVRIDMGGKEVAPVPPITVACCVC